MARPSQSLAAAKLRRSYTRGRFGITETEKKPNDWVWLPREQRFERIGQ